jgi:cation diffusion facilitator family transporter
MWHARDGDTVPRMIRQTDLSPGGPVPAKTRLLTALLAAAVGAILLGFKYLAYRLTGSTAIFADALASIVSLVGTLFSAGGLVVAGWPGDHRQLDADGKLEFFRAAFQAGMVALAAVLIIKESGEAMLVLHQVRQARFGLLISAGAGLATAALGWHLLYTGRRLRSLTMVADGSRLMADFWTSAIAAVGLGLVLVTRAEWFDVVAAAAVGLNMIWTGLDRIRYAASGLLDEEDPAALEHVVAVINSNLVPGVIRVHSLRAARAGRITLIEAHLVVPEFWTVEEAHDFRSAFERRIVNSLGMTGQIAFRLDPCRRQACASCEVDPCPIRVQPFVSRPWINLDEAVRPDPGGQ